MYFVIFIHMRQPYPWLQAYLSPRARSVETETMEEGALLRRGGKRLPLRCRGSNSGRGGTFGLGKVNSKLPSFTNE